MTDLANAVEAEFGRLEFSAIRKVLVIDLNGLPEKITTWLRANNLKPTRENLLTAITRVTEKRPLSA